MPSDRDVDHLLRRIAEIERRLREVESLMGRAGAGGGPQDPEEPSTHVRELVAAGHLIEAIKLYRDETGLGLEEAKRRVEALAGER